MTVITISREFGCYGDLLAERVATALDYHRVDKSFVSTVLCQYGLAEFDLEYEKQPGFWDRIDVEKSDRRVIMVKTLNRLLRTIAHHGNVVILGRSGYAALAGLRGVLHVRLHAPPSDRADAVSRAQGIPSDAATQWVNEQDRLRTAFVESFYQVPWNDGKAFDLAINTSVIPLEVATRWVIEAATLPGNPADNRPAPQSLEVDPVMLLTVTQLLNCTENHAEAD